MPFTSANNRPKAYSYVRFSSPEQVRGDSERRQTELAERYAQEHGLELDHSLSFADLGVSAFQNKNAKNGALRAFLDAVEDGTIPHGSYLLVESLDRLSRDQILAAQGLFMQIIAAGISLVTLIDKRVYSTEGLNSNPTDLIISIVTMMRAHDESLTKSRRLIAVHERKRALLVNGDKLTKPYTKMLPAWLTWDAEAGAYALIPQKASIVRMMFEKADQGWGLFRLTRWLNETYPKPIGAAEHWRQAYVRRILINPAAVGTFVPHKQVRNEAGLRRRKALTPVAGLWPAVVEREVYERVLGRLSTTSARGRNAAVETKSLVGGVLKCARCGGSFVRVSKPSRRGSYVYLVCSRANAKAAGCTFQAVRYDHVEEAMRTNAKFIYGSAPRGRDTADIEAEIEGLQVAYDELLDDARFVADELRKQRKSDTLRAQLDEIEAEIEATEVSLSQLVMNRDKLAAPSVIKRLTALRDSLLREPFDVAAANRRLKETVRKIVIDPEHATLSIHWHHADQESEVMFHSRHMRWDR